jgi:hypothetical protein
MTNSFTPSLSPSTPVAGPSYMAPTSELDEDSNAESEDLVILGSSPGAKKKGPKKPRVRMQPNWIRQQIDQHFEDKYHDPNYILIYIAKYLDKID